jgi:hypothetical protein
MIESIRSRLDQETLNDGGKGADKITRHMDLTIMKAGKKNLKSSRLQKGLGRSDSHHEIFQDLKSNWGCSDPR